MTITNMVKHFPILSERIFIRSISDNCKYKLVSCVEKWNPG